MKANLEAERVQVADHGLWVGKPSVVECVAASVIHPPVRVDAQDTRGQVVLYRLLRVAYDGCLRRSLLAKFRCDFVHGRGEEKRVDVSWLHRLVAVTLECSHGAT